MNTISNNPKIKKTICPHCGKECNGLVNPFNGVSIFQHDCDCQNKTEGDLKLQAMRKQQRLDELFNRSNIPKDFQDGKTITMRSFPKNCPQQEAYKNVVRKYIKEFDFRKWLTLYGNMGTGKTWTLFILGTYFIRRYKQNTVYISCENLSKELKKGIPDYKIFSKEIINYYSKVDILLIDELGVITGTSFLEDLYCVLNGRQLSGKPTVLAGNMALPDHPSEIIQRIWSRCQRSGTYFCCDWELKDMQPKEQ